MSAPVKHSLGSVPPMAAPAQGYSPQRSPLPGPFVSGVVQQPGSFSGIPQSMATPSSHSNVFPNHGSGGGIRQAIPAQYYAPNNVALPFSPNILHMTGGGVTRSSLLAYPGTSQFQPFLIGGHTSSTPRNSTPSSPHIQLLQSPVGAMPSSSPTQPGLMNPLTPTLMGHVAISNARAITPNNSIDIGSTGGNIPLAMPGSVFLCPPLSATIPLSSVPLSEKSIPGTSTTDMPADLTIKTESIEKNERQEPDKINDPALSSGEEKHNGNKENAFKDIDTKEYNEDGVPVEYVDSEFSWGDFLEQTYAKAVPPLAFKHVEYSLESGFVKGMKLEVPNKCNKGTYWVTSVIMTCGPLLRLRFDGYEDDSSADFWCDLLSSEIHPIGWCAQNNQVLQPPEAIKDKFEDWREFLVRSLTGARTAPSFLLDKTTGTTPVDQLKQGMRLELQHAINPLEVWLVKIIENVGGRLYLRFEGAETGCHDFWLFYLNHRLHPIGWAKANGYGYNPPPELVVQKENVDWMRVLDTALKESERMTLPMAIFKDQEDIPPHRFQKGWKLEALNPLTSNQICPATVIKVLNSKYFVVEIDNLTVNDNMYPIRFSCHALSRGIFPCGWCQENGLNITIPKGWHKSVFSWNEYLLYHTGAVAANEYCFNLPKKEVCPFKVKMKLEAVNPDNPNQICAASVSKVIMPLLWIHLDHSPKYINSHIEHMDSHNLFPVGWCESNNYQLKPPRKTVDTQKVPLKQGEPRTSINKTDEAFLQLQYNEENSWCPKIYYNHKCFSGPFLSKGRIASLPKCVGPGPVGLVMKEVLSNLINVAYKSFRVLRELQLEGKPKPDMQQQTIKAKYKGKSYRAAVEICKNVDQLEGFCHHVCEKLECCPNLISPIQYEDECPEKCEQLTKTKYTQNFGKKPGKIGRPPGGHSNLENGPKKPGGLKRGRKKKQINILVDQSKNSNERVEENSDESDTQTVASNDSNDKETDVKVAKYSHKRKYIHHVPAPSDIKTRGAKLPKYSFERKTHKKILISQNASAVKHIEKESSSQEKNTEKHSSIELSQRGLQDMLYLSSNPLKWSVNEVVKFLKTTECANLARILKEQDIDGQALLLLTLPAVQEYLDLKLGPAIKLCHQIERVKLAFYLQYAN